MIYSSNPSATNPTAKDRFIASNYKGDSIVDFLKSAGQDSSPEARMKLATEYGRTGYNTGANNGAANLDLLSALRNGGGANTGAIPNTASGVAAGSTADVQTPEDMAFEAYIKAMAPTAEETQAKQYLDRLTTDSKLAREKALNSGETMGFAGGEAARVQRNNDITLEGAAKVYDSTKNFSDTNRSISKARYDYTKGKADKIAADTKENTKPFELSEGQKRYTYNPTSKKYELTASAPKTYAPKSAPTSNAQLTDINDVLKQLETHMKTNQHAGIDETGYNNAIDFLQQTYGSKAVNELNKAMANKKLKVDRVNNK